MDVCVRVKMDCAFTLIEVLVVIAIIGILASVVLGSLGPVGGKANRSAYLNETRGSVAGLVRACADNGAFTIPTSTSNVLWPNDWDEWNCGAGGNLTFQATVTNAKQFASTTIGSCEITLEDVGIYIDTNNNDQLDPGEEEIEVTDCP